MIGTKLDKRLESLPAPIATALREILSRARKVIIIRGVCAVLALSLGAALLAMGIDSALLIISPLIRWLLSALVYGGVLASVYVFLVMPLARSFTLAGVARMVEAQHPEMQERISSAIELLTSSDDPSVAGSRELIAELAKAASEDARKVRTKSEISMRTALPFIWAAAVVVLLLGSIFAVSPQKTSFLLARATMPFANMPSVRAIDISVKPGDLVTKRGEKMLIEVALPGDSQAHSVKLLRGRGNDAERSEDMLRKGKGKDGRFRYSFAINSVDKDFKYRIQADGAITRSYQVTAVVPPSIENVALRLEYPAYTGMPQRSDDKFTGSLMALAESTASLSVTLSKPCGKLQMNVAGGSLLSLDGQSASAGGPSREFAFKVPIRKGLFGIYSLQASDEHGFSNPKYERAIQAIPDLPPLAGISAAPQKEIRLRRDDSFPCYFIASDDIGLASVEMLLEKDSVKLPPMSCPLDATAAGKGPLKKFMGKALIRLSDPEFQDAKRISFQIAVTDNLPAELGGPQKGFSESCVILIDDNAQPFKLQALRSQEELLKKQLLQAKSEMESAKAKLPAVRELASKRDRKPEELGKRIDPLRDDLAASDATLKALAEKLNDGYLEKTARQIETLHEEQILKARSLADQISAAETPEARAKLLAELEKRMQKSVEEIAGMLKTSDSAAKAMERALELESIAEKQKTLVEHKLAIDMKANAKTDEDELKKLLSAWRKEQDKNAENIATAAQKTPRENSLKAIAESKAAEQISEKARKLAAEETLAAEATGKAAEIQRIEKKLDALAEHQAAVAELAKSNSSSEEAAANMAAAAEKLLGEKPQDASVLQEKAELKLRDSLAKARKEAGNKQATSSDASSAEAIKKLAAETQKEAAEAVAAAEKAKAAEKTAGEKAKEFSEKTKASKPSDQTAANLMAEKEASLKSLAQKAKDAMTQSSQAAEEAKRLAKELADSAEKFNAAEPPQKEILSAQASKKAAEAALKAEESERASKIAEAAAELAEKISQDKDKPAKDNKKTEPSKFADDEARKALADAAAASGDAERSEKLKKDAEKNIETMSKALAQAQKLAQQSQQEAAQAQSTAQQAEKQGAVQAQKAKEEAQRTETEKNEASENLKKLNTAISEAQKEFAKVRDASEEAQRSANAARQASEQAQRAAAESNKAQNQKAATDHFMEAQKKAAEADAQAKIAKKASNTAAANSNEIRQKLLAELAETQKRLKDKTEELTSSKQKAIAGYIRENAETMRLRQENLAKEARELAESGSQDLAYPERKNAAQAAAAAEKTDELLKKGEMETAAKSAAQTAAKLSEIANKLETAAAAELGKPRDKEKEAALSLNSQLAEHAAKLASEQEALRREMEALAAGNTLAHTSAWQEEIKDKSAELQKEAAQFEAQARALRLPQPGQQQASNGERELQDAVRNAANAEKSLAKLGDENATRASRKKSSADNIQQLSTEARKGQNATSNSLEKAAASMQETQAAIEQAAKAGSAENAQGSASELPQAAKLAQKAARRASTPEAIQAAESMMAAAEDARRDAEKSGANTRPAMLAAVQSQGNSPNSGSNQEPPGFDAISMRFGIKIEDWLKLPGNLQSEILQSSSSEVPEEYREAVRRYFEELSKRNLNNK